MTPRTVAGAAIVALALAACGSSSSKSSKPGASSTTASSPSSTSSAQAVVKTASNAKFGTILVDSEGRTLYTLTSGGKAVACTGGCLGTWPPLLLPSGVTSASGASGVTGLGTTSAGGGQQVTQNGLPLYRFAGDGTAGDANGDGITSFGGTWHVVKAGASSSSASGGSTASSGATSSSMGGSGY